MRRLGCLVLIIGLVVALFAADLAVTSYAERRTAERVGRTLDSEAAVELGGWPVSVRMLLGNIPSAHLTAADVPLSNGATLDELDVELTGVELTLDDLTGADDRLPPAREGTFEAELGESSVAALLGVPAGLAQITLEDDVVGVTAAGLSIEATVEARDGDAVVALGGPLSAVFGGAERTIDLSEEPGQPFVEEVEIADGVMTVRGTLEEVDR